MGSHWEPTQDVLGRCHTCIVMSKPITTHDVCRRLGLTEPALRHVLRRDGAPRPTLHPSARVFLWTEADVADLATFLGDTRCEREEVKNAS